MKKHFTLFILLIILAFLVSGCYTKIAHPGEESGQVDSESDNFNDHYGYTHYYYPSYWSVHGNWGRYYAEPWWWDYYDNIYYIDDNDDNDGSPRPDATGQAIRPDGRWQPSGLDGANQINTGSSAGASGSSGGTTSSKQTSTDSKDKPETKTKEEPSQQEDSKEETTQPKGRWQTK
ncbi:MAG: hypothetical protein AB1746_17220 [Candidatus Zixiibacteriota bacterium]